MNNATQKIKGSRVFMDFPFVLMDFFDYDVEFGVPLNNELRQIRYRPPGVLKPWARPRASQRRMLGSPTLRSSAASAEVTSPLDDKQIGQFATTADRLSTRVLSKATIWILLPISTPVLLESATSAVGSSFLVLSPAARPEGNAKRS